MLEANSCVCRCYSRKSGRGPFYLTILNRFKNLLWLYALYSGFSQTSSRETSSFLSLKCCSAQRHIPADTRRKLNVHKASSERLMYVQFTSCVEGKDHAMITTWPKGFVLMMAMIIPRKTFLKKKRKVKTSSV